MTDGSGQSLASQAMVHGAVMAGMPVSANFVGWNTHDRAVAARPEGGNQGGGRENSGNGKGNGGKPWLHSVLSVFDRFPH